MTAERVSVSTLRSLYAKSGAARWDVSLDTFSSRIRAAVERRFRDEPASARAMNTFAGMLHVEDLALACACAAGHEAAWEHFVRELRPALYAAARRMSGASQELADSLYAELYGLESRGGSRRSLLDYYHGRARLSTWLGTVLAQRHVDALRSSSRTVPLEDGDAMPQRDAPIAADPHRAEQLAAVQQALDAAVGSLDTRDRLRLRLYYGQGLKLAQIGKLLQESEATVSRKLDRTRRHIREEVERTLVRAHRLTGPAVQEWLQQAAGAPELDISRALAEDS